MDVTYSTLAYADAIHDFKDLAIHNKRILSLGLPGQPMNIDMTIKGDFEDAIRDIFFARCYNMDILTSCDPEYIHSYLSQEYETFGLISDANGSRNIINMLEIGTKSYYIIINRETICDSANTPKYSDVSKGIIAKDTVTDTVYYPKWIMDEYMSSKFCSNYDYNIKYNSDTDILFNANSTTYVVNTTHNPNTKENICEFIYSIESDINKSIAFQRKRSGDWFQALSAIDIHRLYILPTGVTKKLTCPIFFCTEDRIAAAYSVAIGINTIYLQRSSQLHMIFRFPLNATINMFSCSDTFDITNHDTYVREIESSIKTVEMVQTIVLQELEKTPSSDKEIMQYIGYLYDYTMLIDTFQIDEYKLHIFSKFVSNPYESNTEEQTVIYNIYKNFLINIPKLMSHDIHEIAAFPHIESVHPISLTGIVGPSEIYIAGLLNDFAKKSKLLPYIHKCIRHILTLSVSSPTLTLHYETLLRFHVHTGGFIKKINYTSEYTYIQLCNIYIDFIKSGKRYYGIKHGEYGFYGSGDIDICLYNLKYIIRTTGIMKEQYHEFELYMKEKQKDIPPTPDLESDVQFLKSIVEKLKKQGKSYDFSKLPKEFMKVYERI